MGLINLKTNLKSLRYGNDQLGGGSSNQPYIKTDIPAGFNNLQLLDNDFILRGGALAVKDSATDILRLTKMFTDTKSPNGLLFIAKQNLLSRTAVRTQTSGRTLNEGIYTPLSTLAEAGLVAFGGHVLKQGLNPFAGTGAYSNNPNLYGVKVNNNQPIEENRLVRLYQAKTNFLVSEPFEKGVILNSDGINVISYNGGPGSILGIGKTNIRYAQNQLTGKNNYKIPSGYYDGPISWTPPQQDGLSEKRQWDTLSYSASLSSWKGNSVSQFYQKINEIQLGNAFGSDKVYQQGKVGIDGKLFNLWASDSQTWIPPQQGFPEGTIEKRNINNGKSVYAPISGSASPTKYYDGGVVLKNKTPQPNVSDNQQFPQNTFTYTQENIKNEPPNSLGSPSIQDFRKIIRSKLSSTQRENSDIVGATPDSPDYSTKNIEARVNIGGINKLGPGNKTGKDLVSYTEGSKIGPVDLINASPLHHYESSPSVGELNDLVKFRIAVINNQTPTFKTFMHFRAFIDSFSDAYNSTWNPITYLGRGENFYTYSNFTRTINLNWTVAAQSKEELIPMYKKLNYLVSSLTPDYTPKGYMAGNLIQLTVGGYLYEQVGFFTSLTYDMNDSTWEIGLNDNGGDDTKVKELPKVIKVTAAFTPIHDFIPSLQSNTYNTKFNGTGVAVYGPQHYIALAAEGGTNNYTSDDILI